MNDPRGLAIHLSANRIYWANFEGATISWTVNLDGTGGGGDLDTTGRTVERPMGLAIDDGRIYWTNSEAPKGVFYASLSGGGGGVKLNSPGEKRKSRAPTGIALDPGQRRGIFWANGQPAHD